MPICYLILFPLLGFLINGFLNLYGARNGKKISAELSGGIATIAMALSFIVAAIAYFKLTGMPPEMRSIDETLFSWIRLGSLNVDFALRLDSLSIVFALVITGVGTLIHLYSISYLHDDATPAKYFAFLNLFCFMMLNLVLGATLPHVFLGWEGVGLASYLLIGYWSDDFANVIAGQKAFVMNRIGDLGFLIAMFVAFKFAGTLDLMELNHATLSPHVLTVFGLLIFFACTGKSAQIPLFTWLPDAMAGPTPVSALIHAATMVTSGIYLITRLHPLILASPVVLMTVAGVGAVTALLASIIACSQVDIKKILAYSTISQLGFMFVGCGVGSFDSGVFHVMTHAFFKALLFLGAGSVIHALSGEQNIFKMGGLRKAIPITFLTFTAGWAAILGLPPFAGFFSKDEIIYQTFASPHSNKIIFATLLASAFLTAFYMTRLYVLVFFGASRVSSEAKKHLHESPTNMTLPLVVLAVLSLAGGWFGSPIHVDEVEANAGGVQYLFMGLSVLVALAGAALAYQLHGKTVTETKARDIFGIDRFYSFVFGRGTPKLAEIIGRFIEESVIQRGLRMTSAVVDLSGNILRVTQVGSAQAYLMMILVAIVAVLGWFCFGIGQYGKL
jgi:NADH-quinone oxidoreductase subunit L